MNIFVKLNEDQGGDLGPNFTLTANVGTLVPATATLTQLLTGIMVAANDAATQVFITSQGVCTNTLTISISTTTTTSTSTTTSTTTTNALCLLSGGTVVKTNLQFYPNAFVFGTNGVDNICVIPPISVYGPPCPDPLDPFCLFYLPPYLFLDPCGTTPVPSKNIVSGYFGGFLPRGYYNYNSTTGAVGAYISSCL